MTRAKDISKIITDADLSGTLDVTGTVTASGLTMDTAGNSSHTLEFGANRTSDSQALGIIRGSWNGTVVSQINLSAGDDTTNKDNGQIFFRTASAGTTANRVQIAENGDISFYEDTGTTPKFFWDASTERLGLGIASPSGVIQAVGVADAANGSIMYSASGVASGYFSANANGLCLATDTAGITFRTGITGAAPTTTGTEQMRISSGGHVGIGVVPETSINTLRTLQIGNGGAVMSHDSSGSTNSLYASSNAYYSSGWKYINTGTATEYKGINGEHVWSNASSGSADGAITWSERMRIDSSGIVNINTTVQQLTTNERLRVAGKSSLTVSGDSALNVNRDTDDGALARFYRGGTLVGSIGNAGARLFINSGNVGLNFAGDGSNQILPSNAGVNRDAAIILGTTNVRFRSLFLSEQVSVSNGTTNGFIQSGGDLFQYGTSNAKDLVFYTNNSERMRIISSGFTKHTNFGSYRGSTGEYHEFNSNDSGDATLVTQNINGSYTGDIYQAVAHRSASSAYRFLRCFSGNASDVEAFIAGDGNAYADGSWNGGGADYAEYFEWADGNTDNEDRRGYTVVLDNNKIRKATSDDNPSVIIGVISGNPSMVGDSDVEQWKHKYQRDDYGTYILDDNDERVLNTEYDENQEYISRRNRQEWDTVGLMGKLRIRKNQPTGSNWIKMRDVSETVEEWLVR